MDDVQKYKYRLNSIENSFSKLHTNNLFYEHKPKSGPLYRRQAVHPPHETPQGDSVAKPGTLRLIILSSVYESDMKEVHGNCQIRCSRRKSVKRNILGRLINVETISQTLLSMLFKQYCQHPIHDNQNTEKAGHHKPSLPQSDKLQPH